METVRDLMAQLRAGKVTTDEVARRFRARFWTPCPPIKTVGESYELAEEAPGDDDKFWIDAAFRQHKIDYQDYKHLIEALASDPAEQSNRTDDTLAAPAQTVIYRHDTTHDPEWHYYSASRDIVGGGKTLDEAREHYRVALRFSLHTDRLPKIREHIERQAGSQRIWVRTSMASRRNVRAYKEITRQISTYSDEDRDSFFGSAAAGGDPVVLPGALNDKLDTVLGQMTPFDSLVVVMGVGYKPNQMVELGSSDAPRQVMWLVITGMEAKADPNNKPLSFSELGLSRDSSLNDVFTTVLSHFESFGTSASPEPWWPSSGPTGGGHLSHANGPPIVSLVVVAR